MEVYRYKTAEEAKGRAGKHVSHLLEALRRGPILLLLSGGSSLDVVDSIDPDQLGEHVTVGMLDERYTTDEADSNFAQLTKRPFYKKGEDKGVQYIDTRVQNESITELARRYEHSLRQWKEDNPQGEVVITQGIGEDGHTAGIMPYDFDREHFEKLFEDKREWVRGYNAKDHLGDLPSFGKGDPFMNVVRSFWAVRSSTGGGFPLRVTVTMPFLRDVVNHSVVYVVGKNKRPAVERALFEEKRVWEIPARIVHQMKNVIVFTDLD